MMMSIVSLISSALAKNINPSRLAIHWSLLTICFALWQSISSSVIDWWLTQNVNYTIIFTTSGAALVAASICILLVSIANSSAK
jgi:hypothetical protein